jgi:methionyl-tRNA formyltransferase
MTLRITIATDAQSWIHPWLDRLQGALESSGHGVTRVTRAEDLAQGDLCFLLGCGFLISPERLTLHRHNLVVHESALPEGRGWSPMTWQILEGRAEIPITLFEAAQAVDSGPIYLQDTMVFSGHELVADLRRTQGEMTVSLCERFVAQYPQIIDGAQAQVGAGTVYARRGPEDSQLDPHRSLAEQFNLLRVVDNERYPAFFELEGRRYRLHITRAEDE